MMCGFISTEVIRIINTNRSNLFFEAPDKKNFTHLSLPKKEVLKT